MRTSRLAPVIATLVACLGVLSDHASAQSICLRRSVYYPAGTKPICIVAADLDGSGHPDLVVANENSYNVSVLRNLGDGTFAAPVNYAVGTRPYSIAVADLDGDSDLDLAVACFGSDSVSILKNNGDGIFGLAVNYHVGYRPMAVCAADLDGDGAIDLAVAHAGPLEIPGSVAILKNNGDGTFAVPYDVTVGMNPRAIVAADLDRDGNIDLAVANRNSYEVWVLRNYGDGTFEVPGIYAVGKYPESIVSADLDEDGDFDLAVANLGSSNVSVLKNNGDGTFAPALSFATAQHPASVAAADIDGDLAPDLEVTGETYYYYVVSILRNNGVGEFASEIDSTVGDLPSFVTAADFNGDGSEDLAVANYSWFGTGNIAVLINCACACPHQGDMAQNGVIDVFDVIREITVAIAGETDQKEKACPRTRGDVNNNGVTDVFDVIYLIATAFSGGPDPINPCGP